MTALTFQQFCAAARPSTDLSQDREASVREVYRLEMPRRAPRCANGTAGCSTLFNCCDCGGSDCGCRYCFSCNACEVCTGSDTAARAAPAGRVYPGDLVIEDWGSEPVCQGDESFRYCLAIGRRERLAHDYAALEPQLYEHYMRAQASVGPGDLPPTARR